MVMSHIFVSMCQCKQICTDTLTYTSPNKHTLMVIAPLSQKRLTNLIIKDTVVSIVAITSNTCQGKVANRT